jgi:hypothetical protein
MSRTCGKASSRVSVDSAQIRIAVPNFCGALTTFVNARGAEHACDSIKIQKNDLYSE